MQFARPEMLYVLAATVPLLVLFLWWSWRRRLHLIREFVQSRLLAQLTVGVSPIRQKIRLGLLAAASALLLLTLARPLHGFTELEFSRRGLDIVVAIDTSRSMLVTDLAPDRLTRAKLAALDLMRLAATDRLALVAFAGTAFLQCPLTVDSTAFQESVNALDTDLIPTPGTALAAAIDTAVAAFDASSPNFKALVLITDGEDHEDGVREAARKAAAAGVRIYALGAGTPEGDQIRLHNPRGETTFLTDDTGRPVVSRLDETLLRDVARITDGEYLPLRGADPVRLIYESRIAQLPASEYGARLGRQYHERFQWPLGLAILLLLVEMLVPCRRRVERPDPAVANPAALGRLLPLLFCVLILPPSAVAGSSPLKAYERGDYAAALEGFDALIAKRPGAPRLHFNAGAAAYRLGQFDRAANEFATTLLSSDTKLHQPAFYNLGNALFRLGQTATDPNDRRQRWQEALQAYDRALAIEPDDPDTTFNRQLVQARLEQLEQQPPEDGEPSPPRDPLEPSEEARDAKARADQAVARRDYALALAIMEAQLAKDPTTAAYADFIRRLREVNHVQNPPHP